MRADGLADHLGSKRTNEAQANLGDQPSLVFIQQRHDRDVKLVAVSATRRNWQAQTCDLADS